MRATVQSKLPPAADVWGRDGRSRTETSPRGLVEKHTVVRRRRTLRASPGSARRSLEPTGRRLPCAHGRVREAGPRWRLAATALGAPRRGRRAVVPPRLRREGLADARPSGAWEL